MILTAMHVGLATEQLQRSTVFQRALYVFTFLVILEPISVANLVLLRTIIELFRDLLVIFKQDKGYITSSA